MSKTTLSHHYRGGTKIQSYERNPADSMRETVNKRKLKREKVTERKAREKKQREDEKLRLMKLKREQIMARLKKIKEVTGDEGRIVITAVNFKDIGINEKVVEEEFDQEKFDKLMDQTFNDDYYNTPDTEKPVFSDDEEDYEWYQRSLNKDKKGTNPCYPLTCRKKSFCWRYHSRERSKWRCRVGEVPWRVLQLGLRGHGKTLFLVG